MALQIIEKYRKPEAKQDDYVFPILDRRIHKTAIQIRDKVRKANKAANKALHRIGEKLGIPINGYINYMKGANIAGFMKVAKSMVEQGVL